MDIHHFSQERVLWIQQEWASQTERERGEKSAKKHLKGLAFKMNALSFAKESGLSQNQLWQEAFMKNW